MNYECDTARHAYREGMYGLHTRKHANTHLEALDVYVGVTKYSELLDHMGQCRSQLWRATNRDQEDVRKTPEEDSEAERRMEVERLKRL